MFFSNPKKITLTLFVYTAFVFALATSSTAHIQQRDHANLKRLIKKRSPAPQDNILTIIPVAGAGAAVPSDHPTSSGSASHTASVSASSSSAASSSASSSASASSSTGSSSSSASESSTTSRASASTSTTPSSTSAAPTSETLNVSAILDPTTPVPKSIVTLTSSVAASETSTAPPLAQSGAAKPKSATVTALIVVASSIAGVAILWTVFRKWKLGRSSKFDERLQPIDWQPTNPNDGALPGVHRRNSGASSFHSGSGHPNSARGYGTSDHGHDSPSTFAIPDHDFTAGPSTLAPVGGYADLARGPSPQPQMNQMGRGPSLTHPAYDVGVPLHHQTGYATQDAYEYPGGSRRY